MRLRLLVAAVLLIGCKKSPPPEPAAAAAVPAAPSALESVPLTESTLSVFEPSASRCEWLRVDAPARKKAVVATFDGPCVGAKLSFAPDQTKALVWFDPTARYSAGYFADGASKPKHADEEMKEGEQDRLFEVALADGKVTPVPFPDAFHPVRVGYDDKGRLIALAVQNLSDAEVAAGAATVDGKEYRFDKAADGLPALANAYALEGGAWKRVETKPTHTGWDYALDERALDASKALGPDSAELLEARNGGDEVDAKEAAQLAAMAPRGEGQWAKISTGGGPVYFWQVTGEFAYATGLLVFSVDGKLVRAPQVGFSDGEIVALEVNGPFLLVAAPSVGAFPRLYDMRVHTSVYSSETGRAAVFWPNASPKK
jgi:hypothetical protein